MPERAGIPLFTALAVGFLTGLIASVLQLTGGAAVTLGLVAATTAAIAGAGSLARTPVDAQEKAIVGVLRAALSAGLAGFTYIALLLMLRDGSVLAALLSAVVAGVIALLMVNVVARSRGNSGPPRARPTA